MWPMPSSIVRNSQPMFMHMRRATVTKTVHTYITIKGAANSLWTGRGIQINYIERSWTGVV